MKVSSTKTMTIAVACAPGGRVRYASRDGAHFRAVPHLPASRQEAVRLLTASQAPERTSAELLLLHPQLVLLELTD